MSSVIKRLEGVVESLKKTRDNDQAEYEHHVASAESYKDSVINLSIEIQEVEEALNKLKENK